MVLLPTKRVEVAVFVIAVVKVVEGTCVTVLVNGTVVCTSIVLVVVAIMIVLGP